MEQVTEEIIEYSKSIDAAVDMMYIDAINDVKKFILDNFDEFREVGIVYTMQTLPENVCNALIDHLDINPTEEYRKMLNTAYAFGKYTLLLKQEAEQMQEVESVLSILFASTDVEWLFIGNLSQQIHINRKRESMSDELSNLCLQYTVKEDPETEKKDVKFKIVSGKWGWPISNYELRALLLRQYDEIGNKSNGENVSTSDDATVLFVDGIKITVEKTR